MTSNFLLRRGGGLLSEIIRAGFRLRVDRNQCIDHRPLIRTESSAVITLERAAMEKALLEPHDVSEPRYYLYKRRFLMLFLFSVITLLGGAAQYFPNAVQDIATKYYKYELTPFQKLKYFSL